jgi:hypothetical protein
MKLPRYLRVGRVRYTVHSSSDLGRNGWGLTDFDAQRIDIAKGGKPAMRARTLAHEALHTLFLDSGLTGDPKIAALEERIVSGLEGPLAELIASNPAFVKYITEAMKE